MTRPAIVIGLGGTGQWVLTFLKKELLELGNGSMPPGVKLLSFDTTSKTTAVAGGMAGKKDSEEAIRAGAVELTEGIEFIPIGDNVTKLATEIAEGQHPHLQWFPAKSFLGKLPPAAFNTKEGSGQIRQMGRISIFRDLSAIANSKILSHLRAAMQNLQSQVNRDQQLEVIIVGSMAGGTGAGMLVDMAFLVRAQAKLLVQENCVVRGFFVMPRAFTAAGLGESRDMLARSFASWRELDRFMIVSERFGLRQLNYHSQNQDLRLRIDKRAYDVSYIVDPARQTSESLDNMRAEEGLFPALAHGISAILDEKAGKAYTEFVSTNLAGKLAQLPRRPYHSAVGTYTLKVPVYYVRERFSHQLASEVLDVLLAPEKNEKGRVTRLSETRNREVADGSAGRRAVINFMGGSGFNVDGQEITNTFYLPLVADIRNKEAQRDGAIVASVARGGLTNVNSIYLKALTDIGQDDEGKLLVRDITDELRVPVYQVVPPSRVFGDTPAQAFVRLSTGIPAFREEHYGIDKTAGERLRGKYGKALERAKAAQVARFRKLLQAWTMATLNGKDDSPRVARGGKLGYVRSFYEDMVGVFTYFLGFLNQVRQTRNETLRLAAKSREAVERSKAFYNSQRTRQCVFAFFDDFTHPDAHRAQRNYLLAEQRDIDIRKDDILLDILAETAVEMQSIAQNSLAEVDSWIAHLGTGDAALRIESLYHEVTRSLNETNVNHEIDKRTKKISQLIGNDQYQTNEKRLDEALGKIKWDVSVAGSGLGLGLGIEFPAANPERPPVIESFKRDGEKPSNANRALLLKLTTRPFETVQQERPLAREISRVFDTGENLAKAVDKKAEPFYMVSANPKGPEIVACYIRVKSDIDENTITYFRDFERHMQALNPNIKGSSLTLVDSQDAHKLTVVRSDDLVPSTDFEMWHACREAYIQQVTDPYRPVPAAELHVFPAEINACYYEAKMPPLLEKNYRTLHPEVVALLEDRDRIDLFFRSVALGFVREEEQNGQPYWVFQMPDDKEPMHITMAQKSLGGRLEDDIFQVIHNFVLEGRDQRPGVGQVRWVDWGKLQNMIWSKQRELGKVKVKKMYQDQMDKSAGIVQRIIADIDLRRSKVEDEALRRLIGQEHEDLADLARVIYLEAIEAASNIK